MWGLLVIRKMIETLSREWGLVGVLLLRRNAALPVLYRGSKSLQ